MQKSPKSRVSRVIKRGRRIWRGRDAKKTRAFSTCLPARRTTAAAKKRALKGDADILSGTPKVASRTRNHTVSNQKHRLLRALSLGPRSTCDRLDCSTRTAPVREKGGGVCRKTAARGAALPRQHPDPGPLFLSSRFCLC